MMKLITSIILTLCIALTVKAEGINQTIQPEVDNTSQSETIDIKQIVNEPVSKTECATNVFATALQTNADKISEYSSETEVQQWIYETFALPDVLNQALQCPEFQNLSDTDSIRLLPILYTFPNGRQINISYETQPQILKQRIIIENKRDLPDNNPNPRIGDINDNTVWTNVDPAWYAIMVVQSGSLDNFVGPDKNNTISLKYISDNIDKLYPKNNMCTSKSALAKDKAMINRAMHNTVSLEDDTNDYYVAGDANLEWIGYTEIALDMAITVLTAGSGTIIAGSAKAARASKTLKNLTTTIKELSKTESVTKYIQTTNKISKLTEELSTIDRVTDTARYEARAGELDNLRKALTEIEKADDVKDYKRATQSYSTINQYRHALRGLKIPQRGNVIARTARLAKAIRAANTGASKINKGAKIARASMKSGKIKDWLYHSTMRNISKLGKALEHTGLIYGAINLIGNMYDFTETSTGDFTNNIDFSPLLLLSADDLQGQENVVNYGMWLMWAGDSMSAADDDAAYLQAMDFAAKFHEDLDDLQTEENNFPCDVDIYVVRPILRNPDTPEASIYYLIMNDIPWTTSR